MTEVHKQPKNPLISIIIVNFNGSRWLQACLDSLSLQTLSDFEVIFIDNASTDDSIEIVKNYHFCKIFPQHTNTGFAEGNNIGFSYSSGQYIFLLNTDTTCTTNLLEQLIRSMEKTESDCAQPLIASFKDANDVVIDSVGSYWTPLGILFHQDHAQRLQNRHALARDVFSVKGAAVMIRRSLIEKIGLFDSTFWCYYEESDFCHRALLAGYKVTYVPVQYVMHVGGASSRKFTTKTIFFHDFKNKIRSTVKNYSLPYVIYILACLSGINLVYCMIQLILKRKNLLGSYLYAHWWNLAHLPDTLRLRQSIQKLRTQPDHIYLKKRVIYPSIRYYYHLARGTLYKYHA